MSQVITIVLAAGRGERLGGPKALLAWLLAPHRWLMPLAAAHVEARSESDRVIVVTRADIAERLRRHARMSFAATARGELCISTADDALGPAGSLAAVAALELPSDARLVITPVDCPPAQFSTVARLLDALAHGLAAKPRHRGKGGHPIAMRASLLSRYAEPEPPPLRELLASLGDDLVDVALDDASILVDIDDPEALAAYGRRYAGGADEPAFFD